MRHPANLFCHAAMTGGHWRGHHVKHQWKTKTEHIENRARKNSSDKPSSEMECEIAPDYWRDWRRESCPVVANDNDDDEEDNMKKNNKNEKSEEKSNPMTSRLTTVPNTTKNKLNGHLSPFPLVRKKESQE
ncbi:hypothetical protein E2C01_013321 [Portunus trituberculatus]|uniref:Uncharacterized protein n=1 Tax=Portunus trituberculatus TaxID=210409 RepID=A0A5B7DGS0_PORTR|nr:hypothetical protein [Portunus trituberculatus]